jgi:HAE1 family hydrophobic/amphiphilic exporter-1
MNMSALFIKRPVTTTLLMLGILVFGGLAYQVLPVADLRKVFEAARRTSPIG